MLIEKRRVGIRLLAFSILTYFIKVWIFNSIRWSIPFWANTPEFEWSMTTHAPISALAILGLALYIVGRKGLPDGMSKHQADALPTLVFGSILLALGLYFGLAAYSIPRYLAGKLNIPGMLEKIYIEYSPMFVWIILWAVSGIFLVFDGWKGLKATNRNDV